MNLPNRLTVLRIVMVPAFVLALAYWTPDRHYCRIAALAIFLTACVTDALDGWLARRYAQKTRLGSVIDPLADKILLTSAYLAFAWIPTLPDASRLPFWLTLIVVSRDLILLTGAAIIFLMQNRFDPQTNLLGKLTTVSQMALVAGLLSGAPAEAIRPLIIFVASATLLSGAIYIRAGVERLGGGS